MKPTTGFYNRSFVPLATLFIFAAIQMPGQTTAPPPPALPIINSQHLEVEAVEVHNRVALPSEIHRKPGSFILVVQNLSQDPTAWFVVQPAPASLAADARSASSVVTAALTIGSSLFDPKHRAAVIVPGLAGTYQLTSGTAKKVLCTIVIQ